MYEVQCCTVTSAATTAVLTAFRTLWRFRHSWRRQIETGRLLGESDPERPPRLNLATFSRSIISIWSCSTFPHSSERGAWRPEDVLAVAAMRHLLCQESVSYMVRTSGPNTDKKFGASSKNSVKIIQFTLRFKGTGLFAGMMYGCIRCQDWVRLGNGSNVQQHATTFCGSL